jgi:hypothetical protein
LFKASFGIDHDDIRFWIVAIDHRSQIHSEPLIGGQSRIVTIKRIVEQPLEIAGNPPARHCGRRHHDGNTVDQFPVFFIGPALVEGAERLDRDI